MFSDRHRLIKIGLTLSTVIICGIFFNTDRSGVDFNLNPYFWNNDEKSNRLICFSNVRINRDEGQFFATVRNRKIHLFNLPASVQRDIGGDFAIRGRITYDDHLFVEKIRRKNSRVLKIICSIITAMIVCSLFFVFFSLNRKGFIPKEAD